MLLLARRLPASPAAPAAAAAARALLCSGAVPAAPQHEGEELNTGAQCLSALQKLAATPRGSRADPSFPTFVLRADARLPDLEPEPLAEAAQLLAAVGARAGGVPSVVAALKGSAAALPPDAAARALVALAGLRCEDRGAVAALAARVADAAAADACDPALLLAVVDAAPELPLTSYAPLDACLDALLRAAERGSLSAAQTARLLCAVEDPRLLSRLAPRIRAAELFGAREELLPTAQRLAAVFGADWRGAARPLSLADSELAFAQRSMLDLGELVAAALARAAPTMTPGQLLRALELAKELPPATRATLLHDLLAAVRVLPGFGAALGNFRSGRLLSALAALADEDAALDVVAQLLAVVGERQLSCDALAALAAIVPRLAGPRAVHEYVAPPAPSPVLPEEHKPRRKNFAPVLDPDADPTTLELQPERDEAPAQTHQTLPANPVKAWLQARAAAVAESRRQVAHHQHDDLADQAAALVLANVRRLQPELTPAQTAALYDAVAALPVPHAAEAQGALWAGVRDEDLTALAELGAGSGVLARLVESLGARAGELSPAQAVDVLFTLARIPDASVTAVSEVLRRLQDDVPTGDQAVARLLQACRALVVRGHVREPEARLLAQRLLRDVAARGERMPPAYVAGALDAFGQMHPGLLRADDPPSAARLCRQLVDQLVRGGRDMKLFELTVALRGVARLGGSREDRTALLEAAAALAPEGDVNSVARVLAVAGRARLVLRREARAAAPQHPRQQPMGHAFHRVKRPLAPRGKAFRAKWASLVGLESDEEAETEEEVEVPEPGPRRATRDAFRTLLTRVVDEASDLHMANVPGVLTGIAGLSKGQGIPRPLLQLIIERGEAELTGDEAVECLAALAELRRPPHAVRADVYGALCRALAWDAAHLRTDEVRAGMRALKSLRIHDAEAHTALLARAAELAPQQSPRELAATLKLARTLPVVHRPYVLAVASSVPVIVDGASAADLVAFAVGLRRLGYWPDALADVVAEAAVPLARDMTPRQLRLLTQAAAGGPYDSPRGRLRSAREADKRRRGATHGQLERRARVQAWRRRVLVRELGVV